nr:MAG TPA: Ribonucleotide reductase, small chain [Caudoviricetes sp.]
MEKKPLSKIFTPRRAYKPFEYPETMTFVELMQKSYWVHSEVNFDPDIQDFKSYLYPYEQEAIKRALLGIAQVEVSVKTFWGDLYDIFPKPEFNCLGMSFGECHIEGTEIMTERGFIDFRDLKMTDKVATFDEDRKITFVKSDNIIKKYYKGEMYSFDNTFIRAVVTPNHRFATYTGKDNIYRHIEASNIDYKRKNIRIPVSGIFKDSASVLTPTDRLKIAIELFARKKDKRNINFKDYYPYKIRIKDTDTYAKNKIEEIFKDLPHIQVRRSIDSYGYATYDFQLNKFEGNARKFDWVMEDTRRFDRKFAYSFINELTSYNIRTGYYTSTKKEQADIIQFLSAVAGYRTILSTVEDKREDKNGHKRYVIYINKKDFCTFQTLQPTKINYEGNVYCATVKSTGNLITRYKDKILFSGNSETRHSEAYSRLLEVLGYEEEFAKLLEIPIFQKREEIIRNKLKKTENSIEKILFFTLIIENASLFSQFATILSMTKFKGRLKSTANMIAWTSIDENCLDLETTKILTVKGWTMLRDVKEGDEVFAFSEGKIKVEKVLKTTKRKLGKEKMFKFGNSYSNILMTAGHDVIFKDSKTGRYLKTRADLFRKSGYKLIPITGHLESKKDSVLTDEEKLMIAIQCDGHLRKLRNSKGELTYMGQVNGGKNVVFAMKREDKIKKLEGLLKNLKIDFTKSETNEKGYITFRFNYDLWNMPFPKRYDWVNLKNMNKKYAEDFISEVLSWGSSYTEVGTLVYSTRDKELAEFIQAVGTLAGYVVNFKKRCRKGDKVSYNLNFIYKDFGTISSTSYKAIEVEKSEDTEVGCVTVPSGGIIVKHELGRPMITGNCHANAGTWIINSILAENPEYRDSLESYITHEVIEYMKMEDEMIDWIFECGELQHLPKKHLKDYMRYRIDTSLENLGFGRAFGTNSSHLIPLQWFEEEVFSGETDDFFAKRPTAYTKHDQSITKDDLF